MPILRLVGILTVVVVLSGLIVRPVGAFDLVPHEQILKDALDDGNTLSAEALKWVTASNKASDLHQFASERHFDGAKNPTDICRLWKSGLNAMLERAVELAAPEGAEKRKLKDRKGALEAFGEATHAIGDFYAHTNWVELHEPAYRGNPSGIPEAPILLQSCDPAAFPGDLQSGYFSMAWVTVERKLNGALGCPWGGPPSGYTYCHSQIAKDSATEGHGKDKFGGGSISYHAVAKGLATRATRSAWRVLHDRILARYMSDATDAECLFTKLAWGEDRSCHRVWRADGRITTHQEYVQGKTRLIYDLDLKTAQITLRSQSIEYPGPRAAPIYADVRGTTRQRGTFCQKAIVGGKVVYRRCDPYQMDTVGSDDARLKVSPKSDPIELDWRVTFPGKKPSCGEPVSIRLDPGAPAKRTFPNCRGGMPGMPRPAVITYSGTYTVAPAQP